MWAVGAGEEAEEEVRLSSESTFDDVASALLRQWAEAHRKVRRLQEH